MMGHQELTMMIEHEMGVVWDGQLWGGSQNICDDCRWRWFWIWLCQ